MLRNTDYRENCEETEAQSRRLSAHMQILHARGARSDMFRLLITLMWEPRESLLLSVGASEGFGKHLKADDGSPAVGKANWLVFFNPGRNFFLKQSRNITIIQPIAFLQGSGRLSWGLLFLLFQNPLKVIFLSIECSYFIFQRSPVPVEGLK